MVNKEKQLDKKLNFEMRVLRTKIDSKGEREHQVNFRCSEEQKKIIEHRALKYCNGNLTDWLITAATEYRPY